MGKVVKQTALFLSTAYRAGRPFKICPYYQSLFLHQKYCQGLKYFCYPIRLNYLYSNILQKDMFLQYSDVALQSSSPTLNKSCLQRFAQTITSDSGLNDKSSIIACVFLQHSLGERMKELMKKYKKVISFDSLSYSNCSGNISYAIFLFKTDGKRLVCIFNDPHM